MKEELHFYDISLSFTRSTVGLHTSTARKKTRITLCNSAGKLVRKITKSLLPKPTYGSMQVVINKYYTFT